VATDDQQVRVTGIADAPASYLIPGNGQIAPKAVFASFDGTGAAGAFKPALKITSDGGELIGIYPTDSTVAAGGSADVSWAPFLGRGEAAGSSGTVSSGYAQRFGSFQFTPGTHTFSFGAGTLITNDSSVFSIDTVHSQIAAAHGGLFLTTVFMFFSTTAGIPFTGQFLLTTDVLDSGGFDVGSLSTPEIDYAELYATNGGDAFQLNGFGLVNADDTSFTPPYRVAYTVETDTDITATACSYGVTILNPLGLT
jgi:hypothetical protein